MKPENEQRLKKIQRVSNILRVTCKVGFAVVICVFLAAIVAILSGRGTVSFAHDSVPLAPLTVIGRLLLAGATVLLLAVGLKGFYVISWFMEMAAEMREENELTI